LDTDSAIAASKLSKGSNLKLRFPEISPSMIPMPKTKRKDSPFAHLDAASERWLAEEARTRKAKRLSTLLPLLATLSVCGCVGLVRYFHMQEEANKTAREQAEYDRNYELAEKARLQREAHGTGQVGLSQVEREAKWTEQMETLKAEQKLRAVSGVLIQREEERLQRLKDAETRRLGRKVSGFDSR
jgi:hypothetical protein